MSPFKKPQIPEEREEEEDNIEDKDLIQFESDGSDNEDGLNRREREYFTRQAYTNAIKRLKAILAYSAIWMPDEQAHKLEELYIQFRLESQNLSFPSI